jgi:predicted small lipoprotein YifL
MNVLSDIMTARDRMIAMVRQFRIAAAVLALVSTAGCGIKGPLVLPPPAAPPAAKAAPASADPSASGNSASGTAASGNGAPATPAPADRKP